MSGVAGEAQRWHAPVMATARHTAAETCMETGGYLEPLRDKPTAKNGTDTIMDDDGDLCDIEFLDQDQDQQDVQHAKCDSDGLLTLAIDLAEDNADDSPAGLMCLQSTQVLGAPDTATETPAEVYLAATHRAAAAPTGFEEVSAAFLANIIGQDAEELCDLVFDQRCPVPMAPGASEEADDPTPEVESQKPGLEAGLAISSPPSGPLQPGHGAALSPMEHARPRKESSPTGLIRKQPLDQQCELGSQPRDQAEDCAVNTTHAVATTSATAVNHTCENPSLQHEVEDVRETDADMDTVHTNIDDELIAAGNAVETGDDDTGMHWQPGWLLQGLTESLSEPYPCLSSRRRCLRLHTTLTSRSVGSATWTRLIGF